MLVNFACTNKAMLNSKLDFFDIVGNVCVCGSIGKRKMLKDLHVPSELFRSQKCSQKLDKRGLTQHSQKDWILD